MEDRRLAVTVCLSVPISLSLSPSLSLSLSSSLSISLSNLPSAVFLVSHTDVPYKLVMN